jgi:hypothetical protein
VDKVRLAQLIAIIEPRNWRYDAHGAITCQNDDTSLGDLTEIASALRSYAALREGVPREPTEAMIQAGFDVANQPHFTDYFAAMWRAMYDAAQEGTP